VISGVAGLSEWCEKQGLKAAGANAKKTVPVLAGTEAPLPATVAQKLYTPPLTTIRDFTKALSEYLNLEQDAKEGGIQVIRYPEQEQEQQHASHLAHAFTASAESAVVMLASATNFAVYDMPLWKSAATCPLLFISGSAVPSASKPLCHRAAAAEVKAADAVATAAATAAAKADGVYPLTPHPTSNMGIDPLSTLQVVTRQNQLGKFPVVVYDQLEIAPVVAALKQLIQDRQQQGKQNDAAVAMAQRMVEIMNWTTSNDKVPPTLVWDLTAVLVATYPDLIKTETLCNLTFDTTKNQLFLQPPAQGEAAAEAQVYVITSVDIKRATTILCDTINSLVGSASSAVSSGASSAATASSAAAATAAETGNA